MRRSVSLYFIAILFLLLPASLLAQDYTIRLNSGNFIPAANAQSIRKSSIDFRVSQFQNRHYVVIQFIQLPSDERKQSLARKGIRLIDYIPNNAYTAIVDSNVDITDLRSPDIRSVFKLYIKQKTVPVILQKNIPSYAIVVPGYADITVITYEKMSREIVQNEIARFDAKILEEMSSFRSFTIRVSFRKLINLVGLPFIQWVEPIDPPNQLENILGRTLHRVNVLNDGVRNLKGSGINVGIWDGGAISPHLDFLPAGRLTQVEAGGVSSHSTHCSGTILGKGLIDPRARGMAPEANLYSYNFNGNIQTEMATGIPANNLIVSSHSYGSTQTCGLNGSGVVYSGTSRATDINLNNFPYHLHVHSAGNSQTACTGGWSTITSSGKSAKNNILVANITTAEALSGSSSCGPVQDGRVKPEISSFGTNVLSTYTPLNTYGTISGTSMATPGVAGAVTLLVERFKQLNGGTLPPSSLIKNTVCNTAADLGNPGPDYRFGYGRINALSAVRILEENRYAINTLSTGGSNDVTIAVPAGASRLRVMATWNDPAGTANANPALVNNLDLTVINGSAATTLPWILNPNSPGTAATRAVDIVSNIEQVTIDNPPAGSYTLRVSGTSVPTGPQQYSLTWSVDVPYIEVIYPNGGESFNTGSSETITWDNSGITSSQTVEYSLNNGTSWTTISSSVPASTTRLVWSVPAANTSTALIRVTAGTITDISDANFRILGTVSGLSTNAAACTSGQLVFTWNAVTNATHYDLYSLDVSTGSWVILAADITGTTYSANGLTPGASMWFTIAAKNNTTGAVSVRSLAINRTVPSSGLASIGSISGLSNLCGAATNVEYTIPALTGATSYTWTVPSGASIASGQGTTTISVNYPAGSSSGNVTVFASAGTCQSAVSVLNVTVGSTSISSPVSGGNQSVVHCTPDQLPTLTATASVVAGNSLIWYDAPTGGNEIVNPILNSFGTITYYAASVDPVAGCESATRTPVTLTISAGAPATITASGPLTICDGSNVTLTASAGVGYLWSTGATSQSISISQTGSYTVLVTQGSGCSGTSPATNVVVNPLPLPAIAANGPITFCEGSNVILTASPASSWLWSNGATSQTITLSTPGTFSVTVTDANGCIGTSVSTTVAVNPNPSVTITASPYTRLYPGLTTTLTANVAPAGNHTYSWMKNGNILANEDQQSIQVSLQGYGLGEYSVSVTDAAGCTNISAKQLISDSAIVRLFVFPNPNNGQFQVSYYTSGQENYMITIYDSKGARVFRKNYPVNSPYQMMDVDIRHYSKGTYRIALSDRNGKRVATANVLVL